MANKKRKTLQELTLKDDFMFGAVMADEENCRLLLECILAFPIEEWRSAKKGVRLDIFGRDEQHTCYNVEMQAVRKDALPKRARYYHSQIDMQLLLSGEDYASLADSYVIFICDFDPFEQKKYRYTFARRCREASNLELKDGTISIFLSTHGENQEEVSEELVRFLKFVKADLEESQMDFEDEYVKRLQESIRKIKFDREMERRYMYLFELTLKEERKLGCAEGKAEGKAEDIEDILTEYGEIPYELKKRIFSETNLEVLRRWLKLAARVNSVEQFSSEM